MKKNNFFPVDMPKEERKKLIIKSVGKLLVAVIVLAAAIAILCVNK